MRPVHHGILMLVWGLLCLGLVAVVTGAIP